MVWGESISGFFEIMLIFIQFNGFKSEEHIHFLDFLIDYLFQVCGASLPDVRFQSQAIEALQVGQFICIFRGVYFLEFSFSSIRE